MVQRYLFELLLAGEHIIMATDSVAQALRTFLQQITLEFKGGTSKDRTYAAFWVYCGYLIESRLSTQGRADDDSIHFYQKMTQEIIDDPRATPATVVECKLLLILLHAHQPNIAHEQIEQFTKFVLQAYAFVHQQKHHITSKNKAFEKTLDKLELMRLQAGGAMLRWQVRAGEHFKSINITDWAAQISYLVSLETTSEVSTHSITSAQKISISHLVIVTEEYIKTARGGRRSVGTERRLRMRWDSEKEKRLK